MAFKFSKPEQKELDELLTSGEAAKTALEDAVTTYNETVKAAFERLADVIEPYNDVMEDIREFITSHADTYDTEIELKSDKWQESPKGEAVSAFVYKLRDHGETFFEIDVDAIRPEALEFDELPSFELTDFPELEGE